MRGREDEVSERLREIMRSWRRLEDMTVMMRYLQLLLGGIGCSLALAILLSSQVKHHDGQFWITATILFFMSVVIEAVIVFVRKVGEGYKAEVKRITSGVSASRKSSH